jgi:hypothetical protein
VIRWLTRRSRSAQVSGTTDRPRSQARTPFDLSTYSSAPKLYKVRDGALHPSGGMTKRDEVDHERGARLSEIIETRSHSLQHTLPGTWREAGAWPREKPPRRPIRCLIGK